MRGVITALGIVSCCASQDEIEKKVRLGAELHSLALHGLPFWITLVMAVSLSACAIYHFEKIRNRHTTLGKHVVSLFVFCVLFLSWIHVSNVVFDIAGDFASELAPVGQFRTLGFLLSNPLGAVIITGAFCLVHPALLNSLLHGNGRSVLVASFAPLVVIFLATIIYTMLLLIGVTAG